MRFTAMNGRWLREQYQGTPVESHEPETHARDTRQRHMPETYTSDTRQRHTPRTHAKDNAPAARQRHASVSDSGSQEWARDSLVIDVVARSIPSGDGETVASCRSACTSSRLAETRHRRPRAAMAATWPGSGTGVPTGPIPAQRAISKSLSPLPYRPTDGFGASASALSQQPGLGPSSPGMQSPPSSCALSGARPCGGFRNKPYSASAQPGSL